MAQLTKLGIQNFRVFGSETMTEFDFAPITLLTGANNSGKSSVLKALSLLKNSFDKNGNIEKLNFEGLDLGTYEMNLNKKKVAMFFCLPFTLPFLDDLNIFLVISKDGVKTISIYCSEKELLNIGEFSFKGNFLEIKAKLDSFISTDLGLSVKNHLSKNYENYFKNSELDVPYTSEINNKPQKYNGNFINGMFNYFQDVPNTTLYLENTKDSEIVPTEKDKQFFKILSEDIKEGFANISKKTLNFEYLTPYRANQQILHTTDNQKTDFSILLKKYFVIGEDKKGFVNEKMQHLLGFAAPIELLVENLGKELQIEAYVAYLKEGTNKTILSNLGFGVTQLITLLMQIAVSERGQTIIIEEPETNLHPKLQNELANLFIEAYDKFKIRFIIETHSEHLIRGLQLAIAKDIYADKDAVIYYLNSPNNENVINKTLQQVEKIKFEVNGGIEFKKFDTGFFDDNYNIQYSLLNIQRNLFFDELDKLRADIGALKLTEEDFAKKLEEKVKFFIKCQNITTYEQDVVYELAIKDTQGNITEDRISKINVKEYLASAKFLMSHILNSNHKDYSSVIFQYGLAVEKELGYLFDEFCSTHTTAISEFRNFVTNATNFNALDTSLSQQCYGLRNNNDFLKHNISKFSFFQCQAILAIYNLNTSINTTKPFFCNLNNFLLGKNFNVLELKKVNFGINNTDLVEIIRKNRNDVGHGKKIGIKNTSVITNPTKEISAEDMQTKTFEFFKQWISAKN